MKISPIRVDALNLIFRIYLFYICINSIDHRLENENDKGKKVEKIKINFLILKRLSASYLYSI